MNFFDGSCAVETAAGSEGRIYLCFPYDGNNENIRKSCWIYDGNQTYLTEQTKIAHQGGQLAFFNDTVLGNLQFYISQKVFLDDIP